MGQKNDGSAARSQCAGHFGKGGTVIGDVFDDFVRESEVEGGCSVGNDFGGSDVGVGHIGASGCGVVAFDVEGVGVGCELGQMGGVGSDTAADYQNAAVAGQVGPVQGHGETALLSGPPDEGGYTALGGF